ncbi:MAG: hypothetical protein BMS9Abin05_1180 [Rhodothermia bacterium]|nr:MAG: hypothetical protein BMS9Abin05_1180 [Rhodothermia bacterium]
MSKSIKNQSVPDSAAERAGDDKKSTNGQEKPTRSGEAVGGGADSGPHPKVGPETRPEPSRPDSIPSNVEENPHHDNMGVNSDNLAVSGHKFTGSVERLGYPDDYFYKIGLDTALFYPAGGWMGADRPAFLLDLRAASERLYELERRRAVFLSHEGLELEVYPHGARPGYQILIRDGDGFELRALPKKKGMPDVFLKFGARWCNERTRDELEAFSYGILSHIGYDVEDIMVSQLHLRVDVPTVQGHPNFELRRHPVLRSL